MTDRWPPEIHQLLAGPVDTIEKIEVLLLTSQEPDTVWTAARAAERSRLPVDGVHAALDELAAAGLLDANGEGYRFPRAPGKQRDAVVDLCRLYQADRLRVLKEMSELAMDRIRSSAVRFFADAFRFRRRDPGRGGPGG